MKLMWLIILVFFKVRSANSIAMDTESRSRKQWRLRVRFRRMAATVFLMLGICEDVKSHQKQTTKEETKLS